MFSAEWLLWHMVVGLAAGYGARMFEHAIWAGGRTDQNTRMVLRFAIGQIPQAFVIGGALGLVSFLTFAYFFKNDVALDLAGYALPAAGAFLAGDLRNLLNRLFVRPPS